MRDNRIDIIKQPVLIVLGTFFALIALLVTVEFRAPDGAPNAITPNIITPNIITPNAPADITTITDAPALLSPPGVWFDGLFSRVWAIVLSALLTICTAIVITRLVSRYSISVIRSFLPLVLFVGMACAVAYPSTSPSIQLAIFLLAHSAELMVGSFKRCDMFQNVMCASFYAGLAALLVPDLLWVSLLLALEWVLYRRSLRECIAGAIMFALPFLPTSVVWWITGADIGYVAHEWQNCLTHYDWQHASEIIAQCGTLPKAILLGAIILLGTISTIIYLAHYDSMRTRARKIHFYFVCFFLVGVAMLLLGVPVAVSCGVIGTGAVPLVHTYFVKRAGVGSALIYIIMLVAVTLAILS